ncbi:cobalt-zinc-cadmium efflux system membrane fusion protein [Massilia sp. UYP11]|uniref:efflux RND transporter periplasmic adaptor subunit n=1 Tax=Massilia sp. UYP11 TaxID=1756385 RepID=UPI003D24BCFE
MTLLSSGPRGRRTAAQAAILLASTLAVAGALAQPAGQRIRLSPAQVERAGIATAPALATLTGQAAGGNGVVLPGTVVAPTTAMVVSASAWEGVVQQVHATPLQRVKAGTPLATLFSQDWMAAQRDYVQLAAQSRLAADKLARDESLFNDGIVARVRVDESRAAAQLAALSARQAAQALRAGGMTQADIAALPRPGGQPASLLTVRAGAAGTVLELPLAIGQHAGAGTALAKIVRDGPLWVELQATRQQLPLLRPGAELEVAAGCRLKVAAVSPAINGANQTAQVRAEQVGRQPCLTLNAFVEARLLLPPSQPGALAVPAGALVRRGGASHVFVRDAQGFTAVPVTVGASAGDQVWIRGALAAGAPVAVRGLAALKGAWSGLGEQAGPAGTDEKGRP